MSVEHLEPKMMLTGPQIVGITPSAGELLEDGDVRNTAPQELTFRFDENQIIDAATLGGIELVRTDTGQTIQPGFVGVGDRSNEVVIRFAEELEDGNYRINISGTGDNALRNTVGEAFNDGASTSIGFGLDLAPVITAVVPQPTATGAGISQARNQIEVYFNDDDLNPVIAQQARFYQLIYTADTIDNSDDVVYLPNSVVYDATSNLATLTFGSDLVDLSGEGTYRLRVGTDESLPAAPVLIDAVVDSGDSFSTAVQLGTLGRADSIVSSTIDAEGYPLAYPGGVGEPGRGFTVAPDTEEGITLVEYNFQSSITLDGVGTFFNLITEPQRERAREMMEILASKAGVEFLETASSGITIGTATLPFPGLYDNVVAVPFTFDNDAFGEAWFNEAMRQMIAQLDGEFFAPPDPLFFNEDPTRDFAFITPVFVDPDTPDAPVIDPLQAEQLYPRNSSVVNLQHAHRPEANDIDIYQFELTTTGSLTVETIAERSGSGLDTKIRVYRNQGGGPVEIAQNDDYFGSDSFLDLELGAGSYFAIVTSTGLEFDPASGEGTGGVSQGDYDLRLSFQPTANNSIVDASGVSLDGDNDGVAGGVFNHWFQVRDVANTIYVDKSATAAGQRGNISRPFSTIDAAFDNSQPGDVIRIVGNNSNLAYEVGFDQFGRELPDGSAMVLPQGVTVVIDEGAIFKMRQSSIQVGSSSVAIDLSGSAIQVLGTPDNSVIFTSYNDESIGNDSNSLPTTPSPGDWGGILIRNDLDRVEGRFDYEQIGVFPNYISNAEMLYGGGRVSIASVERVIDPVHLIDARADVAFNRISFSADAAISANPDSFEETYFHTVDSLGVDYQANPFTPDYSRSGPDIHDNVLVNNTTNGLFVRIDTIASQRLERMTVTGRWDDLDVVHVLPENLIIEGEVGPAMLNNDGSLTPRVGAGLKIDPGAIVKLDGSRIEGTLGSTILAEGVEGKPIVFTSLLDDRFGAGGTFDTSSNEEGSPEAGDWAGIYIAPTGTLSIDNAVIAYGGGLSRVEGSFAAFNPVEVHQATGRIANSVIEFSGSGRGGQADLDRPGRPDNAKGAIFLRGSSAIIVNNIIRDTQGVEVPAINVDVSSLNDELTGDPGRSTGLRGDVFEAEGNRGALIRGNRLLDNSLNGLELRGGTVSRGTVLDDTDIVHVIFESIDAADFISTGGIRLQSSPEESLVVKLAGPNAGFVASGTGSGGQVGGILQVIGQPGSPVVMTSLYDSTVGAGFDPDGNPLNTTTSFDRPLPTQPENSFQLDLNYGPIMRDLPIFREASELAARIWESIVEDPIRVTIDVEFGDLGSGTLGVTSNEIAFLDFDNVVDELAADASGRAHEQYVTQLPSYEQFEESVILPDDPQDPFTISRTMAISMANAKALGFSTDAIPQRASAYDPQETVDATITMNDDFETWDPDRSDGLLPGLFDFVGVMIHEIGHALGFVSAVDDIDGALGEPAGTTDRVLELNTLDLFRFSPGVAQDNFRDAPRNLDPGQSHVFYDGGLFDPITPRGRGPIDIPNIARGDVPLSTGRENGDGGQASHWKDNVLLEGLELGIMDPSISGPGREEGLSMNDRQAFDVIGWDIIGGAIPGDWRGVTLETLSHDENLGVVIERESTETSADNNDEPALAEFIGALAPDLKAGDENNRLGFSVDGLLNSPSDIDVYSFDASAGTQIWLDVDRTDPTLDTIVELIDANGRTLAMSDDSYLESIGEEEVETVGLVVNPLSINPSSGQDHFSINTQDAGFRVFLPGASGTQNTYHVRVSSDGLTSGKYELNVRLQELDQLPGSTVRHADINYAVDGVRVRALPGSSPLAGTVSEDASLNNDLPIPTFPEDNPLTIEPIRTIDDQTAGDIEEITTSDLVRDPLRLVEDPFFPRTTEATIETEFENSQKVGNISDTRAGAITISGSLIPPGFEVLRTPEQLEFAGLDIDWYEFEVDGPTVLTLDVDYAAGIAGPNTSIFVYEPFYVPAGDDGAEQLVAAKLLYASKDGRDADDVPAPLSGANLDDLGRGSVSGEDPLLGPIELSPTALPSLNGGFRFLVAVTAGLQPFEYQQFTVGVPLPDPEREEEEGRGVIELPPFPNNPLVRFEPVGSVTRLIDEDFSDPGDTLANAVPHFLGDVPLFISRATNISLVNPYNGSNGGVVGDLDIAIGDFDLRAGLGNAITDDWNFYAYSSGLDDATSGNYLVINPEDASITNVNDDGTGGGQGGGQGGQGQGNFTDDGLVTNILVPQDPPADPPEPPELEASDTGILYEAIEFFDDSIGYAIGNHPAAGVFNILYQFEVPTGETIGDEVDEELHTADGSLTGLTNLADRGVICTDPNARNLCGDVAELSENNILSVMFDVSAGGELRIPDGATFAVSTEDGPVTYEINIGPELIFDIDQADGRTFQDGDGFLINGVRYEFETGNVIVLSDGGVIGDGDTVTITNDSVLNPLTRTFEFDMANDGVGDGNVAVSVAPGLDPTSESGRVELAGNLVDAINDSNAGISAGQVGSRVSLIGDSRRGAIFVSNPTAITIDGGNGVSDRTLPVFIEETYSVLQLGDSFVQQFGEDVVALNDRIIIPGGTADFSSLIDTGAARGSSADSTVQSGSVAINIHPNQSREDVATAIADAIGGSTLEWQVNTDSIFVSSSDQDALRVGGENPGGLVTGMHFLNGELFVVTNRGGLYTVPGFDAEGNGIPVAANYINSSTELSGVGFSGLTLGPPEIEGGRYAETFFATTTSGDVYAFDANGLPQPVFANGATSISTGVGGANGLLFSPADENLWHISDSKAEDIGHGKVDPLTGVSDGGLSFHFGDDNTDLTENRNFNFPGGAHGSLVTDAFSLVGYTEGDLPTAYFNYFLATDASAAGSDSFRVFITDETADEGRGEWTMLASNQAIDQALFEATPLFDNTWEDQPELFPEDPQEPDEAEFVLRRNGLRDPYTENRKLLDDEGNPPDEIPPYPVPSEEAGIWRQARLDLSEYVGSANLRLRFDFSSAGSFGLGDSGGIELRAVAGDQISDGDQFEVDGVSFEFEKGLTLSTPAAVLIEDGETVLVNTPSGTQVLQYVKAEPANKAVYVSPALIPSDRTLFRLRLDGEATSFEFDSDGTTGNAIVVDISSGRVIDSIADAINGAGLPYSATVDGDLLLLSDAAIDFSAVNSGLLDVSRIVLDDGMSPVDVAFETASAINSGTVGASAAQSNRSIVLQGVESVDTVAGSQFRSTGQTGRTSTSDNTRLIAVDDSMSSVEVAQLIAAEIAHEFALGEDASLKTYENTIYLHGHRVTDAGPLGLATVLPGDAGHLYDPIRGLNNQFEYVEIDEDGGGGGGNQEEEPIDETDVNFLVYYEGAYVDDLVVGFAARGEQVVDHRLSAGELAQMIPVEDNDDRTPVLRPQTIRHPGTDFDVLKNDVNGLPPVLPDDDGNFPDDQEDMIWDGVELVYEVDRSHFLPEAPQFEIDPDWTGSSTGPYQLEIRLASQSTIERLAADELLDPRERLAQSITLFAHPGLNLVDGQTFTLSNGSSSVTFEYEDTEVGNGFADGNVVVPFTIDDSDRVVAGSIRDAINNSAVVRKALGITAAGSDFSVSGVPSDNAVQIHGPTVFVVEGSEVEFVETTANDSSNPVAVQGQVIIESNTISNSQMFGVVTDDGYRAAPVPDLFDPEGFLVHWPRQIGDFSSGLGSTKDLISANTFNQLPGIVIANNVIARGGAGGIHASGDPGGYIITPPLGTTEEGGEVWDNYPFIFAITDLNGDTVQFEFDTDGQLNTVTPTIPVTITPTPDCPLTIACMPRTDAPIDPNMSTELSRVIMGSGLDVQVYQHGSDLVSAPELFIEGAAEVVGIAVGDSLDALLLTDWFTPWYDQVEGVRTYTRIVNNTVVGLGGSLTDNTIESVDVFNPQPGEDSRRDLLIDDYTDAGIHVEDGAFPTLVNNITVNLEDGIRGDTSTADSVVGATLFQHNIENTDAINVGDFPVVLGPNDPLFVDIENDNFYLSPQTAAIDSSIDSLEERPELVSLKEPIGIPRSNILSPERDVLGQLREDDPNVETPSGLGQNVFKDRGAIDRVDFEGPTVTLINPRDNDPDGIDKSGAVGVVALESSVLSNFELQFSDRTGIGEGTGLDPNTVSESSVVLRQDGRTLQPGLDYKFSFDATNDVIRLTPVAGVWPNGSTYSMDLSPTIRDVAGNELQVNQATGGTSFIVTSSAGSDYSDAPVSYPQASHNIAAGFFLGQGVTSEDQSQSIDGADDGVFFPAELERGTANTVSVQASAEGLLDAWVDFNADGDWNDEGERVFTGRILTAGLNDLTINVPEEAASGETFARFRLSSDGVAGPGGGAADGEVEDYVVLVDPGNIWQNPTNSFDVTNDGELSARDVLLIIQEINDPAASDPTTGELAIPPVDPSNPANVGFVDVNGDGFVTARDARAVVNAINNLASGEPIVVDPIGDIMKQPVVEAPAASEPPVIVIDLHDNEDDDDIASDLAAQRSGNTVDDVFANLDWIS